MDQVAAGDLYVGVDIGGTFTDLVVMDAEGQIWTGKSSTVPGSLEQGVLNALEQFAAEQGLALEAMLARVRAFSHGTTQATNVLVERDGARTGLLTTYGFGDTIFIQRLLGFTAETPNQLLGYYSRRRSPTPMVPRALLREVPERIDQAGNVLLALDEVAAREAIDALLASGVEAIAIALLWAFRNPVHERRLRDLVRAADPEIFVSISSEVAPVVGEYERTATTVLNSYVAPRVVAYLERLEGELRERGFAGTFRVLNSVGGVMSASDAARRPVLLLNSGPTGGVIGSSYLAEELGHRNVVTTDMGGTSFDVGMIVDGHPLVSAITEVGKYHLAASMIEIRAIGSGGGSIAVVRDGLLQVGPESAGANPGPVCYGRGGTRATVTDADLVLGIIDPGRFLGGEMELSRDAAAAAIEEQIAAPLGLSVEAAAAGIRRVVGSQMADALREATIGRGHDPRDFVVYSYGGAGPTHCADFGADLGVAKIVVPATSMVHSAYGALASDVLHTAEQSLLLRGGGRGREPWDGIDVAAIEAGFEHLERSCGDLLEGSGIEPDEIELARTVDVRYRRQTNELLIEWRPEADGRSPIEDLLERFERAYEDAFGRGAGFREAGTEVTTLRVQARGRTVKPLLRPTSDDGAGEPKPGEREVYDSVAGERRPLPVWQWGELPAGFELAGAALVEHPTTTIFVGAGQRAELDPHRNLIITAAEGR
jgi:N-methylhydantoinase A